MSLRRTISRTLRRWADSFDHGGMEGERRRWPAWASQYAPARQQLATRWRDAARAHYLIGTSPTATSISDQWCTNLIGDGPAVRSGHPDPAMAESIETAWSEWSDSVDAEGVHDLAGMLNAAVRSMVAAGEFLGQMVTTRRGELRVRLLSPEQLDPALTREIEDMSRIIAGVEFDATGRRVAYHVFPRQADLIVATMQWAPVRLVADDVLHVFESRIPGQVRGASWLAPVLDKILKVDELETSLAERARVAALFAGFISDPSGTSGFGEGTRDPQELSLEPGTLRILPADASITFPTVPDTTGTEGLLRHLLRQISAGTGVPYELLAADLSNTNYSSAKMGLESFKRRCKAIRETLLTARLLRPVWQRWITLEVLSGRLYAPDFERNPVPYLAVNFLFPEWASLDPLKEANADVALINAGVRSRQEVISARGRDFSDVDAEIQSDNFVPRAALATSQGESNVA